jgi:hypothetical protein
METKLNTTNLVNDGAAAGFIWETGEVQYQPTAKGAKISLGDAPHVKVVDVPLFEAAFPGVILTALNGTSIKVACQAVTRRMKLKNRQVSDADMAAAVLNSLRGIKNRASVVHTQSFVFGGKEFATRQEAIDYGRQTLEAKGLDADLITEILEGAIESEVEAA